MPGSRRCQSPEGANSGVPAEQRQCASWFEIPRWLPWPRSWRIGSGPWAPACRSGDDCAGFRVRQCRRRWRVASAPAVSLITNLPSVTRDRRSMPTRTVAAPRSATRCCWISLPLGMASPAQSRSRRGQDAVARRKNHRRRASQTRRRSCVSTRCGECRGSSPMTNSWGLGWGTDGAGPSLGRDAPGCHAAAMLERGDFFC